MDERIVSIEPCSVLDSCTLLVLRGRFGETAYVHSELDKNAYWLPNLRKDDDPIDNVSFPDFDRNNRGK